MYRYIYIDIQLGFVGVSMFMWGFQCFLKVSTFSMFSILCEGVQCVLRVFNVCFFMFSMFLKAFSMFPMFCEDFQIFKCFQCFLKRF